MRGIVFFCVLFASASAFAQDQAFTDKRTGCKLWLPIPMGQDDKYFKIDTARWTGACRNGSAQGRGTFEMVVKFQMDEDAIPEFKTWKGEGEFVDGRLNGRGFLVHGNMRVEGEFRNGLLNGRGIEQSSRGRREGEFRDGLLNGWGVEDYKEEIGGRQWTRRYEGEFRAGQRNGKGLIQESISGCSSTLRYEGELKDNLYDGRGTLNAPNGRTYTGVWQRGDLGDSARTGMGGNVPNLLKACGVAY